MTRRKAYDVLLIDSAQSMLCNQINHSLFEKKIAVDLLNNYS